MPGRWAGAGVIGIGRVLPTGGSVSTLSVLPDGSHVVYRADQNADELFEIFSASPATDADGDGLMDA